MRNFIRRLCAVAGLAVCAGAAAQPVSNDDHWVHRIQRGDTLIGLHARLMRPDADWREVQRLNRIANPRRLQPGRELLIPWALLRAQPLQGEVLHVHGDVTIERPGSTATALASGAAVAAGDVLRTGAKSSASLRMADGSRIVLHADSRLRIERGLRLEERTDLQLRLDEGEADTRVPAADSATAPPARRVRVRTPIAILGVRGTEFRTRAADQRTGVEVLEGVVGAGTAAEAAVKIPAGYGSVVTPAGAAPPTLLPPAPDLSGVAQRIERLPLVLSWPAGPNSQRWLAQVFAADAGDHPLLRGEFASPVARWSDDLPDGTYRLRVRAIGPDGLAGRDAQAAFELAARPEPPLLVEPRPDARTADAALTLRWARSAEAARFRLQLGADAAFAQAQPTRETDSTEARVDLALGTQHWRVASVRADGRAGPWSDAQRITRVEPPAAPAAAPPEPSNAGLLLRWRGAPGLRYQVQVARDADFAILLVDETTDQPQWLLREPQPGAYHLRVRSIDAEGFSGPFGAPQTIDHVPPRPWWLLLPAVLILLL